MKVSERQFTQHELVCILYEGLDGKEREKWVDIQRLLKDNKPIEVLVITIGSKEITAFDLEILKFLRKKEII